LTLWDTHSTQQKEKNKKIKLAKIFIETVAGTEPKWKATRVSKSIQRERRRRRSRCKIEEGKNTGRHI
jgi:hypothetical protein